MYTLALVMPVSICASYGSDAFRPFSGRVGILVHPQESTLLLRGKLSHTAISPLPNTMIGLAAGARGLCDQGVLPKCGAKIPRWRQDVDAPGDATGTVL